MTAPTKAAPEASPWENTKSVVQPSTDRRRLRWNRRHNFHGFLDHQAALAGSWDIPNARLGKCGRTLRSEHVSIRAAFSDDGPYAYADGLVLCGRVWGCPICSAVIRARRAIEVELAALRHSARGGSLIMVTPTVRHRRADPLADSLAALKGAHQRLQQHRRWRPLRADVVQHLIVATEVTVGPNGFHPHNHDLLFLRPGVDVDQVVAELSSWLPSTWPALVGAAGGRRPNQRYGVRIQAIDAAASAYVSKIADEHTRADLKSDGTNPFALLDRFPDGEAQPIAQYLEYLTAMKGTRAVRMSRGLRADLLADVEELTDEELVGQELNGELLEVVPGVTWAQWCRARNEHGVIEALARLERWEHVLREGAN